MARNAELWTSPTMPALRRYTGVLYDALDVKSFTKAGLEKAHRRLAVTSSLFGVVSATDPIPAYRLSGGNSLPALGTVRGHVEAGARAGAAGRSKAWWWTCARARTRRSRSCARTR